MSSGRPAPTRIRGHERPSQTFWVAAVIGAIAAVVFGAIRGGGLAGLHWSDLLPFAAVIVCAIGYAEGRAPVSAISGRRFGG